MRSRNGCSLCPAWCGVWPRAITHPPPPSVGRPSHDRAEHGPPCGPATGWSCQEGQASPACAPCASVHGGRRRRLKPCEWLSRSASGRPIASSASHAQSTAPARLRATRRPPSKVQSAFMLKPSMLGTFPRLKVASRRWQWPSSTTKKTPRQGGSRGVEELRAQGRNALIRCSLRRLSGGLRRVLVERAAADAQGLADLGRRPVGH